MSDLNTLSATIAKRGSTGTAVAMLLAAASAFAAGDVAEARGTLASLQASSTTTLSSKGAVDSVLTAEDRDALKREAALIRDMGRAIDAIRAKRIAAALARNPAAKIRPIAPGSRRYQISAAADLIDAASLVSRGSDASAAQLVEMTLVSTDADVKPSKLWNLLVAPIGRMGKPLIDLTGKEPPVQLFEDLSLNGIGA